MQRFCYLGHTNEKYHIDFLSVFTFPFFKELISVSKSAYLKVEKAISRCSETIPFNSVDVFTNSKWKPIIEDNTLVY